MSLQRLNEIFVKEAFVETEFDCIIDRVFIKPRTIEHYFLLWTLINHHRHCNVTRSTVQRRPVDDVFTGYTLLILTLEIVVVTRDYHGKSELKIGSHVSFQCHLSHCAI